MQVWRMASMRPQKSKEAALQRLTNLKECLWRLIRGSWDWLDWSLYYTGCKQCLSLHWTCIETYIGSKCWLSSRTCHTGDRKKNSSVYLFGESESYVAVDILIDPIMSRWRTVRCLDFFYTKFKPFGSSCRLSQMSLSRLSFFYTSSITIPKRAGWFFSALG